MQTLFLYIGDFPENLDPDTDFTRQCGPAGQTQGRTLVERQYPSCTTGDYSPLGP